MRTSILSFVCVCLSFSIMAQIEKGSYMIGNNTGLWALPNMSEGSFSNLSLGSTSFFSSSETALSHFNLNLSPSVSYFVKDNLSIGLISNIYYSRYEDNLERSGRESYFALGPQAHYFMSGGKFSPYFTANATIGYRQYGLDNMPSTQFTNNLVSLGAGSGLAYFVNKNCAFNLELFYNYIGSTSRAQPAIRNHTIGVDIGVKFFLR